MTPELLSAIERVAIPYEIDFERFVTAVPGFYRAPVEAGGLRVLVDEFAPQVLVESGLFYAASLRPVIAPGGVFVVLRDREAEFVDVLHERGCASDRVPPLQVFRDATFLDCQRGFGRVCFVESLHDMAVMRAAEIRACPGGSLLGATRDELGAIFKSLVSFFEERRQEATFLAIRFAEWSPFAASYEISPQWQEVLSFCERFEAVTSKQPIFYLWRPSRAKMADIQLARRHNPEWLWELLRASFGTDNRWLEKREQPLEQGEAMVLYQLGRLHQVVKQSDSPETAGFRRHTAKQEFLQAVVNQFAADGLPLAAADSPQNARLFEAKLRRQAAMLKIPDYLFESAKLYSVDPQQVAQVVNSRALRELLEAAHDTAEIARDILAESKKR